MGRFTAVLLVLCAGCADSHSDCLWQDSFVGDLARIVCCPFVNHKNAAADCGEPAPVVDGSEPAPAPQPTQK